MEGVTKMVGCKRSNMRTLNAYKCEVTALNKNFKAENVLFFYTAMLSKFLGVIIDRALSFGPHVAAVLSNVSSAFNECRVSASLAF